MRVPAPRPGTGRRAARPRPAPGERVATLSWNHHAHLECYFGIPAVAGVMHTLNLRLSPDELGWIAHDAQDRFLIVDDVLLPLYEQFAGAHRFERVIVVPFSGAPVPPGYEDYEALLARSDPDGLVYAEHREDDPVAMCYTSGTTGRPKGVVYSHRSTVLHALVGCLPDHWGCKAPTWSCRSRRCSTQLLGRAVRGRDAGVKLVLPGPHLHPEDLLEPDAAAAALAGAGVPTIWMA